MTMLASPSGALTVIVPVVVFAGVAAAGEALFVDRGLARCAAVAVNRNDARHAVGITVDGDDERRRAGVAIRIGDRGRCRSARCLAGLQRVNRRVGVVERVGVAAPFAPSTSVP